MPNRDDGFLRTLWTEYCQGGTIYAMRHLTAKFHISARVWWFFWIGLAIVACMVSMGQLYEKWIQSPVVISYDPKFLPVWYLPFPAVTVCPMARAQVELFNSSDVYFRIDTEEGLSDAEYERLRALYHVCPDFSDYFYQFNDTLPVNYAEILEEIAIPFNSLFASCRFRKYPLDCRTYISISLTDGGICYTFNAINAEQLLRTENLHDEYVYSTSDFYSYNWTLQEGYMDGYDSRTYPLRPVGGGLSTRFQLVFNSRKVDHDYLCDGPSLGYKVAIHSPDEMPSVQNNFYRLTHNTQLTLIVQPELTHVTQGLKKHPYTRRQCYFSGERYLRYFKVYNRNNCRMECISNLTAHECGCVGFYMPRSADLPICDGKDFSCPADLYYDLLQKLHVSQRNSELDDPCGCLPACTSLRYVVELSQQPWDFEGLARAIKTPAELYEQIKPAVLVVALKTKWLLPMRRQELFGVTDMLAKFGGLFGLAMGASGISLLEVVYYCLIRPCRNDYPGRNAGQQVYPWAP